MENQDSSNLIDAGSHGRRLWLQRTLGGVCVVLWCLIIAATVAGAYGGYANPDKYVYLSILSMCFPGLIILTVVLTALAYFTRHKIMAWMGALTFLACVPAMLTYSPVNIGRKGKDAGNKEFTVMTWNIQWWYPYDNKDSTVTPNPDMVEILERNPGVLVLQESQLIQPDTLGITREQYAEFCKRYPYRYTTDNSNQLTLYSQYPVTRLPVNDIMEGTGVYSKYRLSINGHLLTLFNVHLQSLHLTPEDKALYMKLLQGVPGASELRMAKTMLIDKLSLAYKVRALQARRLRQIIDETPGNIIVCGDFNDIPGSYAIRTLRGNDLNDAYVNAGNGPGISFRSYKMFFRIDHILYRGDFTATDVARLRVGQSDHFPIYATFRWEDSPVKEDKD